MQRKRNFSFLILFIVEEYIKQYWQGLQDSYFSSFVIISMLYIHL